MGRPRALLILVALALFLLSIQAIRAGGQDVRDAIAGRLEDPLNAFGLSWAGAYLALSGSPVAALAVTLHADGVVDALTLFVMVVGSRLGAEAIVLVAGAIAMLRSREAGTRGVEVGFLAFLVSFTVYLPALLVGSLLLRYWTPTVDVPLGGEIASLVDILRPVVRAVVDLTGPGWAMLLGVAGLWGAFRIFERNLPRPAETGPLARAAKRMFLHPSLTFLLGAAVTLVVTTVSISMTLLVPLHMRGYVTRGQLAAYMLGAGVTTIVDTLFAAVVNRDPVGEGVVLLLMLLVGGASLVCLVWFPHLVRAWNRALDATTASTVRMVAAAGGLVAVPVLLALV